MNKPHIILIHGLYMNRLSMKFLQNKFKRHGYETSIFTYPSLFKHVQSHAEVFNDYVKSLNKPCVVVAHSLGGLVTHQALAMNPELPILKLVTCGTPFKGADIAKRLQSMYLGIILGAAIKDLVFSDLDRWNFPKTKLGIISGTHPIGLGTIIINRTEISDGTVYLKETIIDGFTDRIELPLAHTTMLFKQQLFNQALHFICHDQFNHMEET